MAKWLLSLPKNILVALVLSGAVFFIVIQDPPRTICRTQLETFKARQTGLLYKDPEIKIKKKPLLVALLKNCKQNNSPGSCYGLFAKIKGLINDFNIISKECYKSFASLGAVKKALFDMYELLIRIAWGDAPPQEPHKKLNWLSDLDVSLFCLLKKNIKSFYGSEELLKLEKRAFKKLPGVEKISEEQVRELALVSEECSQYPAL